MKHVLFTVTTGAVALTAWPGRCRARRLDERTRAHRRDFPAGGHL